MGAFAAQGIAGFRQMADSVGKDIIAGALINGQVHINFGNGDITQGIAKLDQVDITVLDSALALGIFSNHALKLVVVRFRRLLDGVDVLSAQGTDGGIVFLNCHRSIPVRQSVADEGIRKHGRAG